MKNHKKPYPRNLLLRRRKWWWEIFCSEDVSDDDDDDDELFLWYGRPTKGTYLQPGPMLEILTIANLSSDLVE